MSLQFRAKSKPTGPDWCSSSITGCLQASSNNMLLQCQSFCTGTKRTSWFNTDISHSDIQIMGWRHEGTSPNKSSGEKNQDYLEKEAASQLPTFWETLQEDVLGSLGRKKPSGDGSAWLWTMTEVWFACLLLLNSARAEKWRGHLNVFSLINAKYVHKHKAETHGVRSKGQITLARFCHWGWAGAALMRVSRTSVSFPSAGAHLKSLLELRLLGSDPGGVCRRKLSVFSLQAAGFCPSTTSIALPAKVSQGRPLQGDGLERRVTSVSHS